MDREPDLVVIGGGAGGLAAARAGVRRGARTLLVQQGPLGGDCTFTGCVPSAVPPIPGVDELDYLTNENVFELGAAPASLAEVITAVLRREGVDVRTGSKVAGVEPLERKGGARLDLDTGETVEADRVLVAVGRRADTEGLGLERAAW